MVEHNLTAGKSSLKRGQLQTFGSELANVKFPCVIGNLRAIEDFYDEKTV